MLQLGSDHFQLNCRLTSPQARASVRNHESGHFSVTDNRLNAHNLAQTFDDDIQGVTTLTTVAPMMLSKLRMLDRAIRLLNPLVSENEQPIFKPEEFSIQDLINEVIYASYDAQHDSDIKVDPAPTFEKMKGYPAALAIALSNLFRNALRSVKDTPEDQREAADIYGNDIAFSVYTTSDEVVIELSDSGAKVDKEKIPGFFDYGGSTKLGDDEPHGIGTGISADIIRSMGGEIEYKVFDGRKFIKITFPKKTFIEPDLDFSKRPPFILYVDDEERYAEGFERETKNLMPKFGYSGELPCAAVNNIEQAITKLNEIYCDESQTQYAELRSSQKPVLIVSDFCLHQESLRDLYEEVNKFWDEHSLRGIPKPVFVIQSADKLSMSLNQFNQRFDNRIAHTFIKQGSQNSTGIIDSITAYIQSQGESK